MAIISPMTRNPLMIVIRVFKTDSKKASRIKLWLNFLQRSNRFRYFSFFLFSVLFIAIPFLNILHGVIYPCNILFWGNPVKVGQKNKKFQLYVGQGFGSDPSSEWGSSIVIFLYNLHDEAKGRISIIRFR